MSDAKKAQLARQLAHQQALARAHAATKAGHAPVVAGSGPLGLPPTVSIVGVNVPSIFVLGVIGLVVLVGAALAIHAVRSK